jgi:hypothetical protein
MFLQKSLLWIKSSNFHPEIQLKKFRISVHTIKTLIAIVNRKVKTSIHLEKNDKRMKRKINYFH